VIIGEPNFKPEKCAQNKNPNFIVFEVGVDASKPRKDCLEQLDKYFYLA
jgi:hypothetical protein